MCYHSKQTVEAQKVEKRFKAKLAKGHQKNAVSSQHWNGFDFPQTPIITNLSPQTTDLYHWGLIPSWAENDEIRKVTLNAKIETLDEKPSFKDHESHRCLVIANGFFEWQWLDSKGKKKQKYEIGIAEEALFAYAGIWSEWSVPNSDRVVKSYAIVTTEAQGIMRKIHNNKLRMPVVLRPDQEKAWLDGDKKDNYIDNQIEWVTKTENYQLGLF